MAWQEAASLTGLEPAWITSPVSKRCLSCTKGIRPGASTSTVMSKTLHVTLKPLLGGTTSIDGRLLLASLPITEVFRTTSWTSKPAERQKSQQSTRSSFYACADGWRVMLEHSALRCLCCGNNISKALGTQPLEQNPCPTH